eukprot:5097433-Pleurochrysis_carterae.AAC.6
MALLQLRPPPFLHYVCRSRLADLVKLAPTASLLTLAASSVCRDARRATRPAIDGHLLLRPHDREGNYPISHTTQSTVSESFIPLSAI